MRRLRFTSENGKVAHFGNDKTPGGNRGFKSVGLIDLYSKNSVDPAQQRSWVAQAANAPGAEAPSAAHSHKPHAISRRLGPETCVAILQRYAAGETAKALAEEFGVARNSVLNLLREHNVVVRCQPPNAEQQSKFVREYEAGATIAALVTRHGHSYGAVRKALKDADAQIRPRGGSVKRS